MDFEKLGAFYLGKEYDLKKGKLLNELVMYDARDLTTHAVCVGMTGKSHIATDKAAHAPNSREHTSNRTDTEMIQHRVELFVFFGKNNDAESPLEYQKRKNWVD